MLDKAKIGDLMESGATALGPALLVALGIAAQSKRSEVVLCTDGLPNIGVGELDSKMPQTEFYLKAGVLAKDQGTSVSILAIEGSTVSLDRLSVVCSKSNGNVDILHPLELVRQIRKISQQEVIATDVSVKFTVHPNMEIIDGGKPTGNRPQLSLLLLLTIVQVLVQSSRKSELYERSWILLSSSHCARSAKEPN